MTSNFQRVGLFATLAEGCAAVQITEPSILRPAWMRVKTLADRPGEKSGAVYAFADGRGYACMNWRLGVRALVFADYGKKDKPSQAEISARLKELQTAREEENKRIEAGYRLAANVSQELVRCSFYSACSPIHSYWRTKHLECFASLFGTLDKATAQSLMRSIGLKQRLDGLTGRLLVIPLLNERWQVVSVEFIDETGQKRFLAGGRKKGCFWGAPGHVPAVRKGEVIGMAEGVATALAVTALYRRFCLAGMDAYNLEAAAQTALAVFEDCQFRFFADKDASGIGEQKAYAAWLALPPYARAAGGVRVPDFTQGDFQRWEAIQPGKAPTDFADLWVIRQQARAQ